jgi:hypothetical protein
VNLDEVRSEIDFSADLAEPELTAVDTESPEPDQPMDSAESDSEYEFSEEDDEETDEFLDELNAILDTSDEEPLSVDLKSDEAPRGAAEPAIEADSAPSEDVNVQEKGIAADENENIQHDNEPRKVS